MQIDLYSEKLNSGKCMYALNFGGIMQTVPNNQIFKLEF